jgi:hypothetical protein
MEHLFSPCTRLLDLVESQGRLAEFRDQHNLEFLQELNLDVSTEELCSAARAFTYADLYAMLESTATVLWLTPHAAVLGGGGSAMSCSRFVDDDYCFECNADGKTIWALADSAEELSEICDVVLRLLAASVGHSGVLFKWWCPGNVSINATSLAYLMGQCQGLKTLTLEEVALDEDQIRVLGDYSRLGLEIALVHCRNTSAGASALVEVLGRNQGPTKLWCCDIDNSVIADGLRGNSRLKSLRPQPIRNFEVELLPIAGALKENKGLVDLDLRHFLLSDELWDAICDSLKAHPTLEVLNLRGSWVRSQLGSVAIASRIQALVDMLKVNMSIHTIAVHDFYSEHELFRGSVIPILETNRFRPCVRAIQKTRPCVYRAKVLGRALLAVRTDPNSFWMLLSENPEVALPSTTATTTPAANLPTSATTSTANVAAAVAAAISLTVSASRADYTTSVSVDACVATPTVCQKRKARP